MARAPPCLRPAFLLWSAATGAASRVALPESAVTDSASTDNPFFAPWTTPFGVAPFADIAPEHFMPAFDRGMAEHKAEIAAIVADPAPADFDNTIKPLERAGRLLSRTGRVFWNLAGAHTSPALQAIEREISPLLARHYQAIAMDAGLFARVEAVERARASLALDAEQARVLELTVDDFVRGGARLSAGDKERLGAIIERLAVLGTTFSQNVLADESAYELPLEREDDLAGLPQSLRDAAAQAAAERGKPAGSRVITLSRSLVVPFLQFSSRRDLREKAYAAWIRPGRERAARTTTRAIVAEMVRLRAERAALLGYAKASRHYKLDDTMAKTPERGARPAGSSVWAQGPCTRALAEAQRPRAPPSPPRAAISISPATTGATTPKRCGAPATTSTRARSAPTSRSTTSSRPPSTPRTGCSAWRFTPRPDVHGLPSRRARLRRHRRGRAGTSPCSWETTSPGPPSAAAPGTPRFRTPGADGRGCPADRRQRDELRQGRRGGAEPPQRSTTRARCSTSSATRCTRCCRT